MADVVATTLHAVDDLDWKAVRSSFATEVGIDYTSLWGGDPDEIDVAAVRERFSESTSVRWNLVRTGLTTAALACLGIALAVV